METNPSLSTSSPATTTAEDSQTCPTCAKHHEGLKKSFEELDQKVNLLLSKMDEIISSTKSAAKESKLPKLERVTDSNGAASESSSSTALSPHVSTRSATEDDEGGNDFGWPKAKNGGSNFNTSGSDYLSGIRKRKQAQNGSSLAAASKIPKQEFNPDNYFNSSMPILTEQNAPASPPMTNQQLLDSLTLATVLGGSEGNDEVLNAFFQSGLLQSDPNLLLNALNASVQNGDGLKINNGMPQTTKKKPASRRSSAKQSAAATPPTIPSPLLSNGQIDDFTEEQLREALAISAESNSQQCSNCFATKTSAWRRNQDGQLICNACGLYFRMHQTNRPIHLRKNHIQTRYRRKNGQNGEFPGMMDDENTDLNSSSFNNSGFEMLFGNPTMA